MGNNTPYTLPFGNQQSTTGNIPTSVPGPQIDISQQQSQQPQQQQPQESWWKKLLPVAGAVGGGILGEVVDPFGGGILGSVLGESLFGGAGQAAGKVAENISSGQSIDKDVLSNALQGAAFGGIGGGIGGGFSKLGSLASKQGAKVAEATAASEQTAKAAEEEAYQKAAQQTAQMQTEADLKAAQNQKIQASIANWGGVKTDKVNNLSTHQANLEKIGVDSSSPTAVNTHAINVLAQTGGKLNQVLDTQPAANMTGWLNNAVKRYGLKPQYNIDANIPAAMIEKAGGTTGSAEAALTGSGSSLETGINNFLKSHLDENGKPLYTFENLNSGQIPLKDLKNLRSEIGTQQNVELANSQSLGRTVGTEAATTSKVNSNNLGSIKDELTSKLSTPEVNKAIEQTKLTPDEELQIRTALKDTPQAADEIINGINNAKSYEDMNKLMSPAIEMRNVSNEALGLLQRGSGDPLKSRIKLGANPQQGILEAPSTPPAQVPVKPVIPETQPVVTPQPSQQDQIMQAIQTAHPVIGTAITGAKLAKAIGTSPSILNKTGTILSRIGKVAGPTALGAGALGSTLSTGGPAGGAQQPLQQGVTMQQQANPLQNILAQATNNYMLDPLDFGASSQNMISSLLPVLQQQAKAQSQMNALQQLYGGAGGAQGFSGNGFLNQFASVLPWTQQAAAMKQAQNLGQTLGVNPQLSFLQSPQTAGTQMGALQNIIQGVGGVNPGMAMPVGQ